jgi:hypothetical protein
MVVGAGCFWALRASLHLVRHRVFRTVSNLNSPVVLLVGEITQHVAVKVVQHLDLSRVQHRGQDLRLHDAYVVLQSEAYDVDGHQHTQRQQQQQGDAGDAHNDVAGALVRREVENLRAVYVRGDQLAPEVCIETQWGWGNNSSKAEIGSQCNEDGSSSMRQAHRHRPEAHSSPAHSRNGTEFRINNIHAAPTLLPASHSQTC